jgi:hypothetical protein
VGRWATRRSLLANRRLDTCRFIVLGYPPGRLQQERQQRKRDDTRSAEERRQQREAE